LGIGPFGSYGYGGALPGPQRRFPVRPDPVTLAAIARETDGKTYRATSASKVDNIYRQLGGTIAHHAMRREVSSWFVGAAALFLLGALGLSRVTGDPLT
jgi:hypothetical protein